jgi:hypothetical protein
MITYIERAVATVREKIVFVAQSFCASEIESYKNTVGDLNYPARLLEQQQQDDLDNTIARLIVVVVRLFLLLLCCFKRVFCL